MTATPANTIPRAGVLRALDVVDASVEARLWPKVAKNQEGGCWMWLGFLDKAGYGRLHGKGRGSGVLYVHRVIYELEKGPIPEGTELDHLCRNRGCCNPEHLEAVSHATNIRRGLNGITFAQRALIKERDGMPERDLLQMVRDLAHMLRFDTYHTLRSKGSEPGYPDVHLVKTPRQIFVELKRETGKPTDEQWYWLDLLAACGNETAVWRPSDMRTDVVVGVLRDGLRTDHRTSAEYAEWLAKQAGVRR